MNPAESEPGSFTHHIDRLLKLHALNQNRWPYRHRIVGGLLQYVVHRSTSSHARIAVALQS